MVLFDEEEEVNNIKKSSTPLDSSKKNHLSTDERKE